MTIATLPTKLSAIAVDSTHLISPCRLLLKVGGFFNSEKLLWTREIRMASMSTLASRPDKARRKADVMLLTKI